MWLDYLKGIALYWLSILTFIAVFLTAVVCLAIDGLLAYIIWTALASNLFVGVVAFLLLGFVITAITFLGIMAVIFLAEKGEELWDKAGWLM